MHLLQKGLKAEGRFWKAGYPRSGTSTSLNSLCLSCMACWLLSCPWGLLFSWDDAREESSRTRQQEAKGPPRRSRGQHLILLCYGQTRLKVRSVVLCGRPPLLGQRRNVRTLPLSIFCSTWFIGSDLWQLGWYLQPAVGLAAGLI